MATKTGDGGPHPNGPQTHAEATFTAGAQVPRFAAFASVAGAVPAQETLRTASLGLTLHDAEPFAVSISSPGTGHIEIQEVEVQIYENTSPVYRTTLPLAQAHTVDGLEPRYFPFSAEQTEQAAASRQPGNLVEVTVSYLAQIGAKLTIGIVEDPAKFTGI